MIISDKKIVKTETNVENLARRNPLKPSDSEYKYPALNCV